MIVNHTSVVSIIPNAHAGAYHASKAASAMLTDTLRLEMKPFGIRSNFFENLKADANAAPKLPRGFDLRACRRRDRKLHARRAYYRNDGGGGGLGKAGGR
jgi:NAD(P)-dependent dehydrogenase (short-subunit alcohol dehydrogenase family)